MKLACCQQTINSGSCAFPFLILQSAVCPLYLHCMSLLGMSQVRSRFADAGGSGSSGKEDFRPLLSALKQLGFKLVQQDASNRMFVVWVLQKKAAVKAAAAASIDWPHLRACVYKKR